MSDKDGQRFIIDGQQRLTTLTLLLIFLKHRLADSEQAGQLAKLIFSERYGTRSFNLNVPERTPCIEALYAGEEFSDADVPESVGNILLRYADLEEQFPDELSGTSLPYFVDWLRDNVHLIEITAYSDGGRLHDIRNDERPWALAHTCGHAKRLLACQHFRHRNSHTREPGMEGARAGTCRDRQG